MALLDVRKRQAIQEVVDGWRERCLLEDGSLLFEDEQVWTPENLALLYHNVIEVPLEDERSFLEKYREQLRGSRMELQIGFIVDFARRLKEHPVERRREILADPWQLRDFMDAGAEEETTPGMRHVLRHLLQPDYFERIARGAHKQSIASTYAGFVEDGEADLDERLLTIRERLEELLKRPREQVDFYEPPLEGTWGAERQEELERIVEAHVRRLQLLPRRRS